MLSTTTGSNEPTALCRTKAKSQVVHQQERIQTNDHKDHLFSGVMFDVECNDTCPLEFLEISSIWIRGDLGPITVWALPGGLGERIYEPSYSEGWQLIYEKTHSSSPTKLVQLALGDASVKLEPNTKLGLYIHSKLAGDRSIAYDNQRSSERKANCYENTYLCIHPGLAHLTNEPFGQNSEWWWGSPWRAGREFVGCIDFGICYKMWSPEHHLSFNVNFRRAVKCMLLVAGRSQSRLHSLPIALILHVLHMCHYDWFDIEDDVDDDSDDEKFLVREFSDDDAWFRVGPGRKQASSRLPPWLWPQQHQRSVQGLQSQSGRYDEDTGYRISASEDIGFDGIFEESGDY
jgi:hypothetical protein